MESTDTERLEFYRLIGEGYKAMQDGRTSTIDDVREKLNKRIGKACLKDKWLE